MATRKASPRKTSARPRSRRAAPKARAGFVGRDPSPVLDRYPPRKSEFSVPPPVVVASESTRSPPAASSASGTPLITLDRGFDVDQFSSLLGETSIRVTVPRADLPEVLRRVLEFMGFGVYVYAIAVRPGPSDLLKEFVVELRRIDFSAEKGEWTPFVEKDPPTDRSA